MTRGASSSWTRSGTEAAPCARSAASSATVLGLRSYTTHGRPDASRRRTMAAPVRPRWMTPSWITLAPFRDLDETNDLFAVVLRDDRAVLVELELDGGRELAVAGVVAVEHHQRERDV